MYTTESKLNRLMQTKADLISAFQLNGIEIPNGTPFSEFPEFIKQLSPVITDTTTLADLMTLADLFAEVELGMYEEHEYTEQEQIELMNLLNLILEGETIDE